MDSPRAEDASDAGEALPADATSPAPADASAAVRLVGRFAADPKGARFAWTGSAMIARFQGTSAVLKLSDYATNASYQNHFTVVVDGAAPARLVVDPAHETYVVAKDLVEGAHQVSVTRDTESFIGEDVFVGFDFGPAGQLLAPPPAPHRALEFVGDSITCGYGIEGGSASCPFSTATENASIDFAALTGKELGADVVTQCRSGGGIYRNNDGTTTSLVPALSERILPSRATSLWAYGGEAPDAVVVNLGTNDFSASQPVPPEAGFTAAYRAFLGQLRAHYPKAHLFATLGPLLSDSYPPMEGRLSRARAYIQSVVTAMTNDGDARVHFLEFPVPQEVIDGAGCGHHPSPTTAQKMATKLSGAIRVTLGW